ncbi:MAG: hypothetical protein ACP5FL_04495 [Thermoplasmatota archaeon]
MKTVYLCIIAAAIIGMAPLSGIALYENEHGSVIDAAAGDDDLDPLSDVEVTVCIEKIRSLEADDVQPEPIDWIDLVSDPDFYVKVFINGEEFISPVWRNQKYVYEEWSATADVPDDEEFVDVVIELWDKNPGLDRLCDLSINDARYPYSYTANLTYSIKTGHWCGDDYVPYDENWCGPDRSGYGRLNGCDDNSQYQHDRDCELWFDIRQSDPDGDGIPYWTEVNVYGTDPAVDNTGEDADGDGVPIEWEHTWGHALVENWWRDTIYPVWYYDPFTWEDHENMDPDDDGLTNVEEYLTAQWGSDPFRDDLFIELDQMEAGDDGEPASMLPEGAKERLQTAYDKHNIVYHLDDGCMGGGEMIPFEEETGVEELREDYYYDYFLHGDEDNWRQGVFHYGLVIWDGGFNGYGIQRDMWQISAKYIEQKCRQLFFIDEDIIYASVFMHETGHSLNIRNPGVDNFDAIYPWQPEYWKYRGYRSCMNYGHTYTLVDYSDGSRGMNDFDDWGTLDLAYFNLGGHW